MWTTPHAIFKGLTLARVHGRGAMLFAADFGNNAVDGRGITEVAVDCESADAVLGGNCVGNCRERIGLVERAAGGRGGAVHHDTRSETGQVRRYGTPQPARRARHPGDPATLLRPQRLILAAAARQHQARQC